MSHLQRRIVLVVLTVVLLAMIAVVIGAMTRTQPETTSGVASTAPSLSILKEVHSPGAVALDERLAPGECSVVRVNATAGDDLPDPKCTPGAIDPAVTQNNIAATICTSGYTATVRPPASESDRFKATALAAYGETGKPTTELDHLVSLELGGANSASNLWPEPNRSGATGTANPKDAVEGALHKAVCDRRLKLAAAQQAIARDWVTALKDLGL
ncbi:hypothetical protein ACQCSX_01325 [Pseudarthrobacter sp. P1]|uniref:hypothetical protein n=1 Tax=Pseudarthrobacter sp. P1 TaxID=3418418 RepID=UPI003CEE474D